MARNFIMGTEVGTEDIHGTAERLMKLFRYSHSDAVDAIEQH